MKTTYFPMQTNQYPINLKDLIYYNIAHPRLD